MTITFARLSSLNGGIYIPQGGGGSPNIIDGRISTGSEANNGNFPSSWTFTSGTQYTGLYDGDTSTDVAVFQDKVAAVKLSTSISITGFRVYYTGSSLCWGYSTDGVNWTLLQGNQTTYASGDLITTGFPVTAQYFGCGTGNGGAAIKEIVLTFT